MVADFQRRVSELRFLDGVEKVEHVPYPSGDEFWVRFNRPVDLKKLDEVCRKHGWQLVKFGGLPSKLPKPLSEVLSDGVNHVIVRKLRGVAKLASTFGFEPDGIAKLATDAHGPYQIFIATQEDGVQILYEYLDLEYTPPAPPPKPTVPIKPQVAPAPKPASPTPSPIVPAAKPAAPPSPATPIPPATTKPPPTLVPQPKPAEEKAPASN